MFPEDAQCCVVVAEDTCASGTHTCQQLCIDTYRTIDGGYKCDCRSGYMLNSDNQTCSGRFSAMYSCIPQIIADLSVD